MIGKITLGSSFRACISYCLEVKKQKSSQEIVFRNRAEVVAFNQCYGNKKELIEQFNDVRALNQIIQKPVMHICLSFAPGEHLEKAKLQRVAAECAKEMGFDKNQYLAVSHIDTGHQHVHIVANRVGYDGKIVSDSNNYKKIAQYCRATELKHNLKQVLSPARYLTDEKRNIPRMDARKKQLGEAIRESLSSSKNFNEFESKIVQKGYKIIKGRGISFVDEQAVRVKGSEVGYSLQKIEKILGLQQQLHQVKQDKSEQGEGIKPEQGEKISYELFKEHWQRSNDLAQKEHYLSRTINIILRPETNESNVPVQLVKDPKKKKRRLHQHL